MGTFNLYEIDFTDFLELIGVRAKLICFDTEEPIVVITSWEE